MPSRTPSTPPRLDPRTKLAALLCLCIAAFLARGPARLGVLLGASAVWAALCPTRPRRWRAWGLLALTVLGAAGALVLSARRPAAGRYATPLARLAVLLLAGQGFAGATPVGELACALQKMHCPRTVVLIFVTARQMFTLLARELQLARDAARIRARSAPLARRPGRLLAGAWRVAVAFCVRLFVRSDEMAAAAESRAFSRPGRRGSLREVRFRARDALAVAACCVAAAALCGA